MQTLTNEQKETQYLDSPKNPDLTGLKARQKATWEAGDYGQIAQSIEHIAEEFMERQSLRRATEVLDVACGTGNLALIAARQGCRVHGIDVAANLLAQARARAAAAGVNIVYEEADAEAMPFPDHRFDLVLSMFGVMFTPQPAVAAAELRRVTRPGGRIALANWTPEGFIGRMFTVFKTHLPPPPSVPSPMAWGHEGTVQQRLQQGFTDVRLTRRIASMRYPFPPAETVDFFRKHYGPTLRAFESLSPAGQAALRRDLVELQTRHNIAQQPGHTEVAAEYLEVVATRT
ncbi:MAG TPA: class I SAM-dependent methyltransferase [Clostridia bacterium]|nr:class I SAM-dependent methyltransferase [Clostridia bacterium]